jgi:hypothetical protein
MESGSIAFYLQLTSAPVGQLLLFAQQMPDKLSIIQQTPLSQLTLVPHCWPLAATRLKSGRLTGFANVAIANLFDLCNSSAAKGAFRIIIHATPIIVKDSRVIGSLLKLTAAQAAGTIVRVSAFCGLTSGSTGWVEGANLHIPAWTSGVYRNNSAVLAATLERCDTKFIGCAGCDSKVRSIACLSLNVC